MMSDRITTIRLILVMLTIQKLLNDHIGAIVKKCISKYSHGEHSLNMVAILQFWAESSVANKVILARPARIHFSQYIQLLYDACIGGIVCADSPCSVVEALVRMCFVYIIHHIQDTADPSITHKCPIKLSMGIYAHLKQFIQSTVESVHAYSLSATSQSEWRHLLMFVQEVKDLWTYLTTSPAIVLHMPRSPLQPGPLLPLSPAEISAVFSSPRLVEETCKEATNDDPGSILDQYCVDNASRRLWGRRKVLDPSGTHRNTHVMGEKQRQRLQKLLQKVRRLSTQKRKRRGSQEVSHALPGQTGEEAQLPPGAWLRALEEQLRDILGPEEQQEEAEEGEQPRLLRDGDGSHGVQSPRAEELGAGLGELLDLEQRIRDILQDRGEALRQEEEDEEEEEKDEDDEELVERRPSRKQGRKGKDASAEAAAIPPAATSGSSARGRRSSARGGDPSSRAASATRAAGKGKKAAADASRSSLEALLADLEGAASSILDSCV